MVTYPNLSSLKRGVVDNGAEIFVVEDSDGNITQVTIRQPVSTSYLISTEI